ncbi:DeoR/GlpR transcriptional regulator [Methylovirgula sp. 4M-Z18]|uniref:DeoR/GlpR family DNA-binding transcription regulator n=1 Tax=Methylovirgula sp. 4M-Z18 TaxID=2293567 RepID=UPI000E2F8111|nr:DeoR/GlpR family DNA-binding transcription regulator [Methylovirgula sp. 4M-Z18]RFB79299.1 DeoR/GlpR transcriptional regulator [Methylovirgula sp. 4M-Z18]
MHERQRWQVILKTLAQQTVATVAEIAEVTQSSPATARRDVAKLAEQGLLRRVHGGAEAIANDEPPALAARAFDVSYAMNLDKKRAIAAAAMCSDGDSIIINGGTTTYEMVEFLAEKRMQIITNSFSLADMLMRTSRNRILIPGGQIYREQNIILSPYEDDLLRHHYASLMFMSAHGVSPIGVMENDPLLIRAEQRMLERAERLVVLADSSKFNSRGGLILCPLQRIHTLITDDDIDQRTVEALRAAGVQVNIVPVSAQSSSAA